MEEESLIAQRVIYDAMNSADADAGSFPITKEMKQSRKKAYQRQKLDQASKKSDLQKSEKERKRKLKEEEVKQMKRQKPNVEQTIETLRKASVRKPLCQLNRTEEIMSRRLHLLLRRSRRRRCCMYHELCGLEKSIVF